MGIQINGNNDTISALDGSWTSDSATHFTGKVSIGGTLTYEDVTNIDSVGLITARNGLKLTGGNIDIANPASGNVINLGSSTVYANAAINIYRLGNGYADMRLSSNYGAKVALAGASNNTDELYIQQDNQKNAYIVNEADKEMYFQTNGSTRMTVAAGGSVGIGITNPAEKFQVSGGNIAIVGGSSYKIDTHPLVSYSSFVLGGGNYAARLGSTGTSTIRHTQIYAGGVHRATFDGVNNRLGIGITNPATKTQIHGGDATLLITGNTAVGSAANTGGTIALGGIYHSNGSITGWAQIKGFKDNNISNNYNGYLSFTTRDTTDGYVERLRITSAGDVSISGAGTVHGISKLTIKPANRTTAFDATDGDTWHDVVIKHEGDATNNAVGLAFEVSGDAYHKNAGTGIAAIKNGIDSDYGAHLAFITRPQSAQAQERLRIDSSGNVAIGHTNPLHNYAVDVTGTSTRLGVVHSTGTGWKEMVHLSAGTDSDDTGSVVRIGHYGNDRGAYLKAGRGSSDRAIAYFGLRNSSNTDTDLLTFRQDSGEYKTITNSEFRFNLPTSAERAIVAFSDHTTSYNLGSSGGAAIRFKNTSGDHSIEFDTHWSGTHHSTAMTLGRSGSLIMRDSRDASVGRDYTSGTLTNGQSVSYDGTGTTLTNSKLNLNSVGGNGGGWIGCLSISSTDGDPSGAAIICGVHGQGFNAYNKLLSSFDGGITVTWPVGNWNYQIANSSGDTIKYRFTVIHMGTFNTTANGR